MDVASLSSTVSDSSKTESSSVSKNSLEEDDQDFYKDNAASPIDLECFIQAERVTKLLDNAIYKTMLTLCLPRLMRENRTLASILHPQDLQEVQFIFDEYENPLFSSSLVNMAAMEDLENGVCTLKTRVNPELAHLLYILNSYKELQPRVKDIIDKMKAEYYDTRIVKKKHIPVGFDYLLQLEHFRDLMLVRMETTAAEQLKATIKTKKLEKSNKQLIERIQEYNSNLKTEKEHFEADLAIKTDTIRKLEFELSQQKQVADYALEKKKLDTNRQMVVLSRAHAVKSVMLKEVEVETREAYDRILRKNIIDEKNVRARRCKVETQLLSWVQKYDTEMREKQIEFDDFETQYKEEAVLVEKLKKNLEDQSKEFEPLMKEKEEEYHIEMTEKMNLFLVEHAARVIQVAWRDTLANRSEKIKLRKLIKKQQLAAEQAARAAEIAAKKQELEAKKAAKAAKKEAEQEKKAAKAAEKEAQAAAKAEKMQND